MESFLQYSDASVHVIKAVVGPIANNVFVVQCRQTGKSVLIDAANEHEYLLALCDKFDVQTVIQTHGHWDHVGAIPEVRQAGYQVGIGAGDTSLIDSFDYEIENNQTIEVGRLRIRALATPGHTAGSMCYAVESTPLLFSGDTLFPGGPGATRAPDGDFDTIINSIREKIFEQFPDETMILPGHGTNTVVGNERPHLDDWVLRRW